MKKWISAALSAAMLLSPVVAAAETVTGVPGSTDIDVNGQYSDGTETVDVYSVDVEWGSMAFIYSVSGSKTWNPETHAFDASTTGSWIANGNEVTVTNHSSKPVMAEFSFQALSDYTDLTARFDPASFDLLSGTETTRETADNKKTTLTLDGSLPASLAQFTKIGTVTVTLK